MVVNTFMRINYYCFVTLDILPSVNEPFGKSPMVGEPETKINDTTISGNS